MLLQIQTDFKALLFYVVVWFIVFFICVLITRWIFRINKIIRLLEDQNDKGLVQIRLLKKMLMQQGLSSDEVDDVIKVGNRNNTYPNPQKKF